MSGLCQIMFRAAVLELELELKQKFRLEKHYIIHYYYYY